MIQITLKQHSVHTRPKTALLPFHQFEREWKKIYSDTPMQYRDAIRLYYAKEYLNSGYYTVTEIAEKCGFDDVSYFVRFFRKRTGTPPGTYKNIGN